jgi:DNA polymerase-2
MITNPAGTLFSRDNSILPGIIAELMTARQSAKQTKNQPLSYAIKILMNSFYGVLGSPACRFFSPELSQAITGTGQYILKTTCAYIEKTFSHSIVYGDTDSLFLLLGPGMDTQAHSIGTAIVSDVNNWLKKHIKEQFNTDSALELEFEEHFRHFFMPSIRGSTQGSKKRYCGTIEKDGKLILTFKGLESVRSDWTPLAKEFQYILYENVFKNKPVEEYIIETIRRVQKGELDDKLIYRKQLRKPVHEYIKHIPQHVQAAKLLEKPGTIVRYFITTEGPQPIEKHTAPLDYEHYITVQLKPIADSILEWIGKKFDAIISGQQDLFEDDK